MIAVARSNKDGSLAGESDYNPELYGAAIAFCLNQHLVLHWGRVFPTRRWFGAPRILGRAGFLSMRRGNQSMPGFVLNRRNFLKLSSGGLLSAVCCSSLSYATVARGGAAA